MYVLGTAEASDCNVKRYGDLECPAGEQAHHIVPDYTLRYGNRRQGTQGVNRIPGMPSLDDGPAICLSGGAKVSGSDHSKAHEGTDPRIATAGRDTENGPVGLAPIGEILDISIEEVGKIRPHCKDAIQKEVDKAFKDVDRSKYGRTTQQPPKKGSGEYGVLERGETHGSTRPGRRR